MPCIGPWIAAADASRVTYARSVERATPRLTQALVAALGRKTGGEISAEALALGRQHKGPFAPHGFPPMLFQSWLTRNRARSPRHMPTAAGDLPGGVGCPDLASPLRTEQTVADGWGYFVRQPMRSATRPLQQCEQTPQEVEQLWTKSG